MTYFTYDNANRVTQQTLNSGAKDIFGYDSRGRQVSVDHKTSANAVLSEEDYVYDAGGNLTSKTVDGVTTTYTYDDIDQLLTESKSGYSASYTYDANGNRASKTLGGTTETYTNDDADKLTNVKIGGTTVKSFGYDGAGRTTSVVTGAGTTTLAYDYEGRVSSITYPSSATNTFVYNGLDTRVSKVDSAGTATYKRDGAGVTAPVLGDGSAVYTPGISERRSSTTKFYGADRLGTNSVETNTSQAVTATKTYDAFGMLLGSTGSSATPFGFAGQHGYQEDADSGLKLLGHRYYDASTGRFLTRDPIKDGRNWYGYCENNPVKFVDPTGLIGFWTVVAGVVVLGVGILAAPVSGGASAGAGYIFAMSVFGAGASAVGTAMDGGTKEEIDVAVITGAVSGPFKWKPSFVTMLVIDGGGLGDSGGPEPGSGVGGAIGGGVGNPGSIFKPNPAYIAPDPVWKNVG